MSNQILVPFLGESVAEATVSKWLKQVGEKINSDESLVELDIEYKELAVKNGCKNYSRVPALGTNEYYIKAMSNLIINKQDYDFNGELFPPKLQCPSQFKKCPCLNYE